MENSKFSHNAYIFILSLLWNFILKENIMKNKDFIIKFKDNAELAMASYGYFHFANPDYKPDGWWNKDKKNLDDFIKK